MINKLHLWSCGLTLLMTLCFLVFTTATIAEEDIIEDFSRSACLVTSSSAALKSSQGGSSRNGESRLVFAQSNATCPCYSFGKLMSTKWDRCIMASLGFPRMLRRIVGNPPNHEIWTINLHKLSASCQCQGTPAGLCTTGKGERSSEVYHEGMSSSEWIACTDIIKKVAEAQGLICK